MKQIKVLTGTGILILSIAMVVSVASASFDLTSSPVQANAGWSTAGPTSTPDSSFGTAIPATDEPSGEPFTSTPDFSGNRSVSDFGTAVPGSIDTLGTAISTLATNVPSDQRFTSTPDSSRKKPVATKMTPEAGNWWQTAALSLKIAVRKLI